MSDTDKYIDQKGFFLFQRRETDYKWVTGVTPVVVEPIHWKDKAGELLHVSRCTEGEGDTPSEAIHAAIKKVRSVGRQSHPKIVWPDFK